MPTLPNAGTEIVPPYALFVVEWKAPIKIQEIASSALQKGDANWMIPFLQPDLQGGTRGSRCAVQFENHPAVQFQPQGIVHVAGNLVLVVERDLEISFE